MPIFTYRCPQGHEWDEIRLDATGTTVAEGSCPTCPPDEAGIGASGVKVPARFNVKFKGVGWTPKFYPQRSGK